MTQLWYTIRFSLRMLAARPVLAALSILTMGVGIGVTSSQFLTFKGILYPDLPIPEPKSLVSIRLSDGEKMGNVLVHSHLLAYWKEHQTAFDSLFSYLEGTINVFHANRAIRYTGGWVDPDFTKSLGVEPLMGETFRSNDNQLDQAPKAVLSYRAWEQDFSSDPSIIGSEMLVNSKRTMVIGVMPEDFTFPSDSYIWVPDLFYPDEEVLYDRSPIAMVSGRLKDGVSIEEAEAELNKLTDAFFEEVPETLKEIISPVDSVSVIPFLESITDKDTRTILYLSTTAVIMVLLIACANVTNLLLAGFSTRVKEMAIRCALGATKRDIVFQLWIESLVIATVGALLGVIYCMWATDWINSELLEMQAPIWNQLDVSFEFILIVMGVTLVSAFLAGIMPVLRVGRVSINQVLQDDSRTHVGFSIGATNKTLVVLQISISCALLMVAGIMIRQIMGVSSIGPEYDMNAVIGARLALFEGKYSDEESKAEFIESVIELLDSQEAVEAAGITTRLQMLFHTGYLSVRLADEDGNFSTESITTIGDGVAGRIFECLDLNILEGTAFGETEDSDIVSEVVLTQSLARKLGKGESIIGRELDITFGLAINGAGVSKIGKIVGVVENSFFVDGFQREEVIPGLHYHFSNQDHKFITIVVEPAGDRNPYTLIPLIKRCVSEIDPEIPLYFVETPADSLKYHSAGLQFATDIFVLFSVVAISLSFVGIFGITTLSVLERIQEIGIRKALGADGREVFKMIFRKGAFELVVGLVLGTIAGISLTIVLNRIFLNSGIIDPVVYLVVLIILAFSSLMATLYPARKASLIQPAEATRVN